MNNSPSDQGNSSDAQPSVGNVDSPTTGNSSTDTKATSTNFTLPQDIPKIPSLKESIKEFVSATNKSLSLLESKYQETIQKPMTQTVHQLSNTTTTIADQVSQLYQQRHVYGPYTIAGTSLFAGSLATIRRGRISGLVSTIVVGGLSYGIIYGLDDSASAPKIPDMMDVSKILPKSITDLWKSK